MATIRVDVKDAMGRTTTKLLDEKQTRAVLCQKCGSEVFLTGMKLKRVSKILVGSPNDLFVNLPVVYCAKCQFVIQDDRPRNESNNGDKLKVLK